MTTQRNYFETQLDYLLEEKMLKVGMDWFDSHNSQDGEVIYFYLHCLKSKNHFTPQNM